MRLKLPKLGLKLPGQAPKLRTWQRRALYGLFAAAAFLFALRQTFPTEAVKERLVMEAAAQGWQLSVVDVEAAGFAGIGMRGVTLESRDGLRIPIDRLTASLRLWPLLLGRHRIAFDAEVFDGRVEGFAEERTGARRLVVQAAAVDLARATPLRKATGLDLLGSLRGDVDITLDEKEPAKSKGRAELVVDGATVNGGSVSVPGMAGALTIPRVGLGQLSAKAVVKDGRIQVERLATTGSDVELSGEGLYAVIQSRMAYAPVFGKARLRIRDAFWAKGGASALKGLVELALSRARAGDGSYGFQIYGTLSRPQARMAP
jgi:type II secretion system protein N